MQTIKSNWWKITLGILGVLIIFVVIRGCTNVRNRNQITRGSSVEQSSTPSSELSDFDREQLRLVKKYGSAGEGFRWSDDGQRVALGDPNLTEQEVVFTYLRSLSTLDIATAQRYSFKNQVIKTLDAYFSTETDFTYDSSFKKNMYQQVLLSIEPLSIESKAAFASGKTNVAVRVNILDLSYKDFWLKDDQTIFENLHAYRRTESDMVKANTYLYDYVMNYWKSENAQKREVTLNLVLERGASGGYVVTVDTDLDNYAKYVDGETVVSNIFSKYEDYRDDLN